MNDTFDTLDKDIRFLILEREGPEKEFTEKIVFPSFSDSDGFCSDFKGNDIGASKVWLRPDLMQQIPEVIRASSLEDATYLLIGESFYFHSGTLVVSDFMNSSDETPPAFDTIEEMEEYLRTHQKRTTSKTYYPVFGSLCNFAL